MIKFLLATVDLLIGYGLVYVLSGPSWAGAGIGLILFSVALHGRGR